jgi:DNA-binding NtrC family response regulator
MSICDSNIEKILIVDDDPPVCEMMKLAFGRAGYSVFTAISPNEAMDIMRNENCSVLFIDLNLADTSGIDLYQEIKSNHPHSVAFLLSGYCSEDEILTGYAAGFSETFIKPVSVNVLLEATKNAFSKIRVQKNEI